MPRLKPLRATPAHPPLHTARPLLLAAAMLTAALFVAYANTFSAAFHFDDLPTLVDNNPTIRHLWPLAGTGSPLAPPPGGLTTSGRPVLNLTFALNYAAGRLDVRGYHVVNLAIHLAAALALLGLVRRTLLLPRWQERFTAAATPLAFSVALLWALHPLQTEAVTYIVQRAESLASCWVLLTLYAFVRAADSPHPRRWLLLSVLACLLGMGTKEIAAATPVLMLLYDRTFLAGSVPAAWRRHRSYYAALATTWLVLAALIWSNQDRDGTIGYPGVLASYRYALTQCGAIVLYLKLTFWPRPLVFDYGNNLVHDLGAVWQQALLLLAALGFTAVALWRRSPLGYAGACFFALLAPTSSVVPIATQTLAEHRMYLPLAAVIAPLVIVAWMQWGRAALLAASLAALAAGVATFQRNADYRTGITLWRDTLTKLPGSARAHSNLGWSLLRAHQPAAALVHFERTLLLDPSDRFVHFNLAAALTGLHRTAEAVPFFEEALRRTPDHVPLRVAYAEALVELGQLPAAMRHYDFALARAPQDAALHNSLGTTLALHDRIVDGLAHIQTARQLEPDNPDTESNLGNTLLLLGREREARDAFARSLRIKPTFAAHSNLAKLDLAAGRVDEAIRHYAAALELRPDFADARVNLGNAYARAGRTPEAIAQFEDALQLAPGHGDAHQGLGLQLARVGRVAEALPHFEAVVELRPNDAAACSNLGNALYQLERIPEALACYTQALQLQPGAAAHSNLGNALLRSGRLAEAMDQYQAALKLAPGFAEAHHNLALALERAGRAADAIFHLETALQLRPDYPEARHALERLRPDR